MLWDEIYQIDGVMVLWVEMDWIQMNSASTTFVFEFCKDINQNTNILKYDFSKYQYYE